MRNKYQTDHINFRATTYEKQAVIMMASREGINKTEMLRQLIREGADKRGLISLGLIEIPSQRKDGQNDAG